MKSLIISLPSAVLSSVAFLILLPRGRNGCACTQGCNPHGRFAGVMTFSDLHCRFVGVKKLVVPSVASVLAGRLSASHGQVDAI